MPIIIVKMPMKREEVERLAEEEFGDLVKAVVDIEQGIMALGGELHADEEVELTEKEGSKRDEKEWIEFDSMINLKPVFNNRSRSVDSDEIQEKIKQIVRKLILE